MFGDNEAFSTHYWGPTTLICILPPSVSPGLVPVTIKENRYSQFSSPPAGVYSFGGNDFKGTSSTSASPRQELDFVDSILNTDVVMFNYRDGELLFSYSTMDEDETNTFFFFFLWCRY